MSFWEKLRPPLEPTVWRIRCRFKMFKSSGNTGGFLWVGLGYWDTSIVYNASGNARIELSQFTANKWHDIDVYSEPYGYTGGTKSDVVCSIQPGFGSAQIAGGEVWISDLYVDEVSNSPGIPQNSQTSAYTIKLQDNGKHIYISTGGVTIPNDSASGLPTEFTVSVINNSGSTQTISKGGSVTLYLSGDAVAASSLVLAARGVATFVKVGTDTWIASGAVTKP